MGTLWKAVPGGVLPPTQRRPRAPRPPDATRGAAAEHRPHAHGHRGGTHQPHAVHGRRGAGRGVREWAPDREDEWF